MFLQNIFELSVPGKEKSFDYTYTLHHVLLHQVRAAGTRGSRGLSPPSDFVLDRSKPSPSKDLVLLFGICPSPHRIFISSYGSASIVAAGHITVNYTEECHSEDGHFKTYFQGQRN